MIRSIVFYSNFWYYLYSMLPILIIGQGIAGTMLAHHLIQAGEKVVVLDEMGITTSSRVAAGLYNPVTGKRMIKTWLADDLFPYAIKVYKRLEQELNISIVQDRNVYKPYRDVSEQNDLLAKSSDERFKGYLNTDFDSSNFSGLVEDGFGGTEVLQAGNIEVSTLLDAFRGKLKSSESLLEEKFNQELLVGMKYKDVEYQKVVFCQGADAMNNELFNWLPFSPTKGEILEVEIKDFPSTHIVSKGFFILPKNGNRFVVGSTYELNIEGGITEKGLGQLKAKLDGVLKVPYKVIKHKFGIRPTVRDRRPFIGKHPQKEGVYIFNGFGTKGVTLSPYFAQEFVDYLLEGNTINKEANIERYYSLY